MIRVLFCLEEREHQEKKQYLLLKVQPNRLRFHCHLNLYKHNTNIKNDFNAPNKNIEDSLKNKKIIKKKEIDDNNTSIKSNKNLSQEIDKIVNKKEKALVKYHKDRKFTFSNLLSYILVLIILD